MDMQFEKREEARQRFSERWNDLKQYKCDPWNELKIFEICLEREPVTYSPTVLKNEFDIGRITTTHHTGGDKEALTAFAFLRFCEESGIPFRIPGVTFGKNAAEGALKRISNYSPYWAFATLIRIGDSKVVDTIFNRKSIFKMEVSQIDRLIEHYLSVIENAYPEIELGNTLRKDNFAIVLASVIPEILSRLCVKCSDNIRNNLLDFIRNLYLSGQKHKFSGVANLTKRLIRSYTQEALYNLLTKFLEFPLLSKLNPITAMEFLEPFQFIQIDNELINKSAGDKIDNSIIDKLILSTNVNNEERKHAIFRLTTLYNLDLLSEEQIEKFSNALWAHVDNSSGFPKETDYYKFAFLKLPHPKTIDPFELFETFILKERFPIQGPQKGTGISMTGGNIPLLKEIIGGTKTRFSEIGVDWSVEQAIIIFNKLVEWWDADKHHLKSDDTSKLFGSLQDEFNARFQHLISIFTDVVAPRLPLDADVDVKATVSRLLNELDEYGILCLRAHAACLHLFSDRKAQVYNNMQDAICSADVSKVEDASNAVLVILSSREDNNAARAETDDVISSVSQQIRWRRDEGLVSSLKVMYVIVKRFPQWLNSNVLTDVIIGLKYLCVESDVSYTKTCADVSDRLAYRELAARLAYKLYWHFAEQGKDIPSVIRAWEDICSSPNEFAEIRNEWLWSSNRGSTARI